MNCTFLPGSSERDAEIHPRVLEEQDRGSELFFFLLVLRVPTIAATIFDGSYKNTTCLMFVL